jgi:pimeloyl-ACP methyl ester carboxylesterase
MVDVNGVPIAYDEAGDAASSTVVFVHAALADRRMWEHQFHALSSRHRVIRYDSRGYGDSGDASGEYAHHEDLIGLLDALSIGRAALVGCSMGGAYALDVALQAPDRVSGLALICAGLSGHRWPAEMVDAARRQVHSAVPPERLQEYANHTAARVDPADVAAMAAAQIDFMVVGPDRDRSALEPAVWDLAVTMCRRVFEREWGGPPATEVEATPPAIGRLGSVAVPTLVISGTADVPAVRHVSAILAEGIPGARRVDLPCGHLPPIELPDRVTAVIVEFLTTL